MAADGTPWAQTMQAHHGHLPNTTGANGQPLDVYVGPQPEAPRAFVIDQLRPDGSFDEHKVMLGYPNARTAAVAYRAHIPAGSKVGKLTGMPLETFRQWLKTGDLTRPAKGAGAVAGAVAPAPVASSRVAMGPLAPTAPVAPTAPGVPEAGGGVSEFETAPGASSPPRPLRFEEINAPSTGKPIQVAVEGRALVPVDKVLIFARGGVKDVRKEFNDMKEFRQNRGKVFNADTQNAARLKQLKKMDENFVRSVELARRLEEIGLVNNSTNNDLIVNHLLDVGQTITDTNYEWVRSEIEGPNGSLKVRSTWTIIKDGSGRAYLSTLILIPMTEGASNGK